MSYALTSGPSRSLLVRLLLAALLTLVGLVAGCSGPLPTGLKNAFKIDIPPFAKVTWTLSVIEPTPLAPPAAPTPAAMIPDPP